MSVCGDCFIEIYPTCLSSSCRNLRKYPHCCRCPQTAFDGNGSDIAAHRTASHLGCRADSQCRVPSGDLARFGILSVRRMGDRRIVPGSLCVARTLPHDVATIELRLLRRCGRAAGCRRTLRRDPVCVAVAVPAELGGLAGELTRLAKCGCCGRCDRGPDGIRRDLVRFNPCGSRSRAGRIVGNSARASEFGTGGSRVAYGANSACGELVRRIGAGADGDLELPMR